MKAEQVERVENLLIAFIERATKDDAVIEELAALPQIVSSLVELHCNELH